MNFTFMKEGVPKKVKSIKGVIPIYLLSKGTTSRGLNNDPVMVVGKGEIT